MQSGKISVQTENIFPIIKKFLYSEQEIFLRELISNAIDATSKLKALSNRGEMKGELGNLNIEIIPNPARDYTTLLIQGFEKQTKEVTMLDFNGKLVFKINVEAKDNQLELNLDKLSVHTGIFLIRVSDSIKQKTEQLVIER